MIDDTALPGLLKQKQPDNDELTIHPGQEMRSEK